MKLELAVLPLEVWADILLSDYNWISRRELAEFANKMKNRNFANKLDKLLHGCGQHTLRYLTISYKKLKRGPKSKCYATFLAVASRSFILAEKKYCKFPESEMPENMVSFKQLIISHLDDRVLDFLDKIKPLFTDVKLNFGFAGKLGTNVPILLPHLLPMVGGIRAISFLDDFDHIQTLERDFPGTLARAKELMLVETKPTSIPTLVNWLVAPQDYVKHGPRFLIWAACLKLNCRTNPTFIDVFIDAVRQQFLAATKPSTFVIFLDFVVPERAEELTIENKTTKEEMTVRNASNKGKWGSVTKEFHYVEILRHPTGANAKLRGWLKERAYYEKCDSGSNEHEQWIGIYGPTIGQISNKSKQKAGAMGQGENGSIAGGEDQAGPSTSA